jgi:hypothetical protein
MISYYNVFAPVKISNTAGVYGNLSEKKEA